MVANNLPAEPAPDPEDGVNSLNLTFSELCHVAYQINGNHEMQRRGIKCLACRPPPHPSLP